MLCPITSSGAPWDVEVLLVAASPSRDSPSPLHVTTQVCSRHVEVLLAAASTSQLLQLLGSVNEANGVQEMASR